MDIVVRDSILAEAEFEEDLGWEGMKAGKSHQRRSSMMESQTLWQLVVFEASHYNGSNPKKVSQDQLQGSLDYAPF